MSARLVRLGLATSVVAWSGLLLAQGSGRIADDVGASTPRRHAPHRKAPKKKRRKKPKPAPDAEAAAVTPPAVAASSPPDAGPDAEGATPAHATAPDAAADDEDEDEDAPGATETDGGAPRRPRAKGADSGADAGPDDDDDEDEDDDQTAYELGAELAAESRLVWRGLAESRGAVLQSSAWAGLYGYSVEGWASYLLNTEGPFSPMTVAGADLTASYTIYLGRLRLAPGVTLLYFPEGLSSSMTSEISFGASYRLGPVRIVSGTNVDVKLEPGAYFGTLGASWERARAPWTVKAIADVGWASGKYNHEYLGRDVAAIDVVHTGVSARYDVGSVLYVDLHVDWSTLVAPTLSGSVHEPMLIVGGAALGLDWSVDQ